MQMQFSGVLDPLCFPHDWGDFSCSNHAQHIAEALQIRCMDDLYLEVASIVGRVLKKERGVRSLVYESHYPVSHCHDSAIGRYSILF